MAPEPPEQRWMRYQQMTDADMIRELVRLRESRSATEIGLWFDALTEVALRQFLGRWNHKAEDGKGASAAVTAPHSTNERPAG